MEDHSVLRNVACPADARWAALFDVWAVAGALALGALVRIPLPFSPVPLTLQTFVVLVAAFAVGERRAGAGTTLYLALGWYGVPLFAVSSGATMGYLLAFVAVPFVVTRFRNTALALLAATLLIYGLGAGWLCLGLGLAPWQAVVTGVAPFLVGDALKAAAAYRLIRWMQG